MGQRIMKQMRDIWEVIEKRDTKDMGHSRNNWDGSYAHEKHFLRCIWGFGLVIGGPSFSCTDVFFVFSFW